MAQEETTPKEVIETNDVKDEQSVPTPPPIPKPTFVPYFTFSSEEPNARYMLGCNNDPVEAKRRWDITREWRTRENIDLILERPQYNFHLLKRCYPHAFYSSGKNGNRVYIERPGRADLTTLWNEGITPELFAQHYIFITEWCWRILDTRDDARIITIYDIGNTRLADFAGSVLQFFKTCSSLMQAHYVEKSDKIFILNARWWFKTAWKIISPLLHENVKRKIIILPDGYYSPLVDYVGEENLPECYGGKCPLSLEEAPAEVMMREHVDLFLKDAPPAPPRPLPQPGRSKREAVVNGWNKSKTHVVRIAGNIKNWYWGKTPASPTTAPTTEAPPQVPSSPPENEEKRPGDDVVEEESISLSVLEPSPEIDQEFANLFVSDRPLEEPDSRAIEEQKIKAEILKEQLQAQSSNQGSETNGQQKEETKQTN